jgi:hypothetical protein
VKINRQNYESYFLDYIDGKLAPHMLEEFNSFLSLNPDLAEEIDGIDQVNLLAEEFPFLTKENLKKEDTGDILSEIETLLIGYLEGDLTPQQMAQVEQMCKDSESVASALARFKRTKLDAEESIIFDAKRLLKIEDRIDLSVGDYNTLAYLEGDTHSNGKSAFEALPEIEKRAFANARLVPDTISFEEKKSISLPEGVDMKLVQNLLVGKIEGDLTLDQNNHLSSLLSSNENLRAELSAFYKTKLSPENIVFDQKDKLRRKEATIIPFRRIILAVGSAAAVIALIFTFIKESPVNGPGIAETKPVNSQQEEITKPQNTGSNDLANNKAVVEPADPKAQENAVEKGTTGNYPHKELIPSFDQEKENQVAQYQRPIVPEKKIESPKEDSQKNPVPQPAPSLENKPDQAPQEPAPAPTQLMPSESNDVAAITPSQPQNMSNLHAEPTDKAQPSTVLAWINETVNEKIENTYAYTFTERQIKKFRKEENKFAFKKEEKKAEVEYTLRYGKFEVSRSIDKAKAPKTNSQSKFSRLQNFIKTIANR